MTYGQIKRGKLVNLYAIQKVSSTGGYTRNRVNSDSTEFTLKPVVHYRLALEQGC